MYVTKELNLISTCIDDMNPELYPFVIDGLLMLGAKDAWLVPVIMKQGRPGVKLEVLYPEAIHEEVMSFLFRETSTLGLRISTVTRVELERSTQEIRYLDFSIPIKVAFDDSGEAVSVKPEFRVCKEVALKHNIPLQQVIQEVTHLAKDILK